MSTPNPSEEITKLEAELKKLQDNYLEAEQVMKNCRDKIIAIQAAIETNKKYVNFEVFNVGSEHNNFTKKQITEQILNIIPNNNKEVSFTNKKFDPRNYKVDFSKIKNKLDFKVKYTIREGIEEIIEFLKKNKINNNKEIIDSFNFGNYQINL